MKILCNHCKETLEHDLDLVVGCLCDSDAPTWVCIMQSKKVVALSHADYTVIE